MTELTRGSSLSINMLGASIKRGRTKLILCAAASNTDKIKQLNFLKTGSLMMLRFTRSSVIGPLLIFSIMEISQSQDCSQRESEDLTEIFRLGRGAEPPPPPPPPIFDI